MGARLGGNHENRATTRRHGLGIAACDDETSGTTTSTSGATTTTDVTTTDKAPTGGDTTATLEVLDGPSCVT